ncbi:MAG: hypothetical protein CVT48_03485 [Thermoplasmata archaeon HGW-Thermoplasmata-1]|nr:MAG: hypothetical protein CVT48_03485 [Thermoplasmata archaeon HGW-Thermoplasmata-1]
MALVEYILGEFPQIGKIKDEELRKKVVETWLEALKRGGWKNFDGMPFTLLVEDSGPFSAHVRRVTDAAIAVAGGRGDLDMDMVIAGALLHDVGKCVEFELNKDGKGVKSKFGKLVRHPVSGAGLAMEMGLPHELVHIIASHSTEGECVKRTPAAVLVHHCDFIDFEILKAQRGL